MLSGPTTNQASSKQNSRVEASGGLVGDVKIENFDIAYGNKWVSILKKPTAKPLNKGHFEEN